MSAGAKQAIPATLNVSIAAAAVAADLGLLWTASHAASPLLVATCALGFAYVNNTVFALLHESVHGLLHPNRRFNDWLGRLLAALFPTALTFQRTCHLGHHRRNRTAVELFDYYGPGDSRLLKAVQWYGILTGLYWLVPPLGCVAFLLLPRRVLSWLLDARGSERASHIGAEAMLAGFDHVSSTRVRLEVLLSAAVQCAIFLGLGLTLWGWVACYAAFGLNWSALQYADHAWSRLDVREGAWNLRVSAPVRWLFLNYHHHLAHHQNPGVPWVELGRYVDPSAPRPTWLGVYLSMWRGPRPLPRDAVVPAPASE